jgi:FMN phosphatase YigB (HAD superfamily)
MQSIVRDEQGKATLTRTCEECPEQIILVDDAPMTEDFAIQLGMWHTLIGESVIPQGVRVDSKYFCSTDCLKTYVDRIHKDLHDAESKILLLLENKRIEALNAKTILP